MVNLRRNGRKARLSGHRETRRGELVRDLLADIDGSRSAQAVYTQLKIDRAVIGLSTPPATGSSLKIGLASLACPRSNRNLQGMNDIGAADVVVHPRRGTSATTR